MDQSENQEQQLDLPETKSNASQNKLFYSFKSIWLILFIFLLLITTGFFFLSNKKSPSPIVQPSPTVIQVSPTPIPTAKTTLPSQVPTVPPTVIPISTISPTPLPDKPIVTDSQYGSIEHVGCDQITGYAYNKNNQGESIVVWVYIDGIFSGTTTADQPHSNFSGITGNHGFSIAMISPAKDNKPHFISVSAHLQNGGIYSLNGSQQYFTCAP